MLQKNKRMAQTTNKKKGEKMISCADCGVALGIGFFLGATVILLLTKYFESRR